MLTLKVVTPEQAENYYDRENYYLGDEQFENSNWLGKGAKELGLKGAISKEDYKNLCHGKLPNGKVFRKKNSSRGKERAGVDLTFSAPKSVSLLALVKGDREVIAAHRAAVEKTIAIAQQRYPATRLTIGKNREKVNTENLVVATYHHDTSRELDPHLHTHCVVMNMTQLPSGKWQSLCNDNFFSNRRLLDRIYQNALAIELQKLGYQVEQQPHEGFEVKGFKPEQIEYFSKRRQQIISHLEDIKSSSWSEREKAWAATRDKKGSPIPRLELMAYWQSEASSIGLEFPKQCAQNIVDRDRALEKKKDLEELVTKSIAHASERSVTFSRKKLEEFIFCASFKYTIEEISAAINNNPELLILDRNRYTTQSAISRELATISKMKQGIDRFSPITTHSKIEAYLENKSLTEGQKQAIILAATNKDRIIAWQGDAGVGKTYALRQFKETLSAFIGVADRNGYKIVGFAPSANAAKVLGDELEIDGQTVASKLVSSPPQTIESNQIWVVDEAGQMSATAALELLNRAEVENARVILVGDTKQLSAVEAGNPFKSLQNHGLKTAHLTESLRQKVPDLQRSVELAARGEINSSIANLNSNGRIKLEQYDNLCDRLVFDYLSLPISQRDRSLVLAGTNKNREAITQGIRGKLKESGELACSKTIAQLVPKDLTKIQSQYSHNLEIGEFVMPVRGSIKRNLERGELYQVIDKRADGIELLSKSGETIATDLNFQKIVYKSRQIEVAEGERLKWKKNDRRTGRRNGQEFTIAQIEGESAIIQYTDGETETINLSLPQYLDYNWVSTTYSSQGKTAERVMMLADSIDRESFYVGISRAKYAISVYTHDLEYLKQTANRSRTQETAIEALKQSRQKSRNTPGVPATITKEKKTTNGQQKPQTKRISIVDREETKDLDRILVTKTKAKPQIEIQIETTSNLPSPVLLSKIQKLATQKIDLLNGEIEKLNREDRDMGVVKQLDRFDNYLAAWNAIEELKIEPGNLVYKKSRSDKVSGQIKDFIINGYYVGAWVDWGNGLPMPEDLSLLNLEKTNEPILTKPKRDRRRSTTISRRDLKLPSHQSSTSSDNSISREDSNSRGSSRTTRSGVRNDVNCFKGSGQEHRTSSSQYQQSSTEHRQTYGLKQIVQREFRQAQRKHKSTSRSYEAPLIRTREARSDFAGRVQKLRAIPIETLVSQLGLVQDGSDRQKWKIKIGQSTAGAITIDTNNQLFYDHLNLKGGKGAIDLVMHVRGCDFQEALDWLDGGYYSQYLDYSHLSPAPLSKSQELKAQKCHIRDLSSWKAARNYLVNKRQLPVQLVDRLKNRGLIDADIKKNVMFFRHEIKDDFAYGDAIGVSLRSSTGSFKGLSAGTKKDRCQFWFQNIKGLPQRIVVTEAAIDALSFAAIEEDRTKECTVYLSKDGSGPIPTAQFEAVQNRGGEIVVATDNDRAGELLAWKIAEAIPNITRVKPNRQHKDWNDQLRSIAADPLVELKNWKIYATAIGKSPELIDRIESILENYQSNEQLEVRDRNAFIEDLIEYQSTQDRLWEWLELINKDPERSIDLKQNIIKAAIDFNSPRPTEIPPEIKSAMARDLDANQSLDSQSKESQYLKTLTVVCAGKNLDSQTTDIAIAMRLMRNYQATEIKKILEFSPALKELKGNLNNTDYLTAKSQYIEDIYHSATELRERVVLTNKQALLNLLDSQGEWTNDGALVYSDPHGTVSALDDTVTIVRNSTSTEVFKVNKDRVITYQVNELEKSFLKELRQKVTEKERQIFQNKRRSFERER